MQVLSFPASISSRGNIMHRLFLLTAAIVLTAGAAQAKTLVAVCSDGQNLQYNVTIGGPGILYLRTPGGNFEVAQFDTGSPSNQLEACGVESGQGSPSTNSQLCINGHGQIYIHPVSSSGASTKVCSASVTLH
jgi:hypothetical protein